MIIRARPKYLLEGDISTIKYAGEKNIEYKGFYFNRGSSALKFVLENLISYLKKDITVCMQSLNCQTVLEAALEVSGVNILLSDIKVDDFSIPLDFLKENHNDIDVLFLLHYQGLVNSEYDEIISFCKANEIIVIEDLAHVLESSHDFKGDFGIYSYAFDKPLTSFSGGKVELNNKNSDFYDCFVEKYRKLPFESNGNVEKDIKLLKYFMHISREDVFKSNLDNRGFVNSLVNIFGESNIVSLLGDDFFYFVFRVVFKVRNKFLNARLDSQYEVLRLHYKKVALINIQYERSLKKRADLLMLQNNIIERLVGNDVAAEIKTDFLWNRISFIPKDSELLPNEVQCGNFNWPTPLHIMYSDLPNVNLLGDYPNTSFVSKSVVNFPCWSDKILDYLA